ncbi:MAG: hypothetical protein NUV32_03235 [Exilispira sp.]|nr:hypothetical protein [Exilispira sp.]
MKINIILFILIFTLSSQLVLGQNISTWFGLTVTSYSANKEDMQSYGIYVPMGEVVYYMITDLNYLVLDADFINLHLLFQNKSLVYGFEFFYETGLLRGIGLSSLIFPSIGGFFGVRPIFKRDFILFQSTVSFGLGFLYIDIDNIKYYDFNVNLRFSHTLYIKIYKQTYIFCSLNYRYYFFFNKDNPINVAQGNFWFGLEWKI